MQDNMRKLLDISNKLFEADLEQDDIKNIFQGAEKSRKDSWFGKEISANDLLKAWVDDGRPTDSRDIVALLKKAKFSDKDINKVFKSSGYGSSEDPAVSPAMKSLSEYIIKNDYTEDILKFLQDNFKDVQETYVKDGNVVYEDIRRIFEDIVKEDRPELDIYLKEKQKTDLGRLRK